MPPEDQAAGLRRLFGAAPVFTLALMGGAPGSGCTTAAAGLGIALARRGRRVALLDCRSGDRGAAWLLGEESPPDLLEAVEGRLALSRVMREVRDGLWVVPAASFAGRLGSAHGRWRQALEETLGALERQVDCLLVDVPRASASSALWFVAAAEEIVVVVGAGAAGITQAYAVVKRLQGETGRRRARILLARERDPDHGHRIFGNLSNTSRRFLNFSLEYMGSIPDDNQVSDAWTLRRPVVEAFPESLAAQALESLAGELAGRPSSGLFSGSYASRLLEAAGEADRTIT